MTFDPLTEVPKNDEQAEIALRHGRHEILATSLVGIYQCTRALGLDVLDAYKYALEAHVRAVDPDFFRGPHEQEVS